MLIIFSYLRNSRVFTRTNRRRNREHGCGSGPRRAKDARGRRLAPYSRLPQLGAPKDTPAAVIDKLNKEINAVGADPIIKARLAGLGVDPMSMTSAEFGKSIAAETEKWAKVIRA